MAGASDVESEGSDDGVERFGGRTMVDAKAGPGGPVRALKVAGAVLAIAAASVIGLHDWADGVATHETSAGAVATHDPLA